MKKGTRLRIGDKIKLVYTINDFLEEGIYTIEDFWTARKHRGILRMNFKENHDIDLSFDYTEKNRCPLLFIIFSHAVIQSIYHNEKLIYEKGIQEDI